MRWNFLFGEGSGNEFHGPGSSIPNHIS
jgi:hypothetical protein